MNQNTIFTVKVSNDLPADERESLLSVLRTTTEPQKEATERFAGLEWVAFIAVMKQVGIAAGATAALVKLANEINTWRRNVRKHGVEPTVLLERPSQQPLDLVKATDGQVRAWLASTANDELRAWLATATDEEVRAWLSRHHQ
jgi:hypothetical protein